MFYDLKDVSLEKSFLRILDCFRKIAAQKSLHALTYCTIQSSKSWASAIIPKKTNILIITSLWYYQANIWFCKSQNT